MLSEQQERQTENPTTSQPTFPALVAVEGCVLIDDGAADLDTGRCVAIVTWPEGACPHADAAAHRQVRERMQELAQLFAAAPKLLEACEKWERGIEVDDFEMRRQGIRAMRAAVKQARGGA